MFKYLGNYHTVFVLERNGDVRLQFNDGGWDAKWIERSTNSTELDKVMSRGRTESDMVFEVGTNNIPKGVRPVWETNLREYLEWHRDNDPSPYSERAAAALAGLEQEREG